MDTWIIVLISIIVIIVITIIILIIVFAVVPGGINPPIPPTPYPVCISNRDCADGYICFNNYVKLVWVSLHH